MCGCAAPSAWSSSTRIDDLGKLRARFVEAGAFIRPIGNVVYLTPALTIETDDLAFLTRSIAQVLCAR